MVDDWRIHGLSGATPLDNRPPAPASLLHVLINPWRRRTVFFSAFRWVAAFPEVGQAPKHHHARNDEDYTDCSTGSRGGTMKEENRASCHKGNHAPHHARAARKEKGSKWFRVAWKSHRNVQWHRIYDGEGLQTTTGVGFAMRTS